LRQKASTATLNTTGIAISMTDAALELAAGGDQWR